MQLAFILTQQTAVLKRKPDTTKDINGVQLILKFIWKCQELRIGQTILKKSKVGKPIISRLNIVINSVVQMPKIRNIPINSRETETNPPKLDTQQRSHHKTVEK